MRASPTVGSASPPVQRAAASATLTASASPSLSMNTPPPPRWIQQISESARNRLRRRSRAARPATAGARQPVPEHEHPAPAAVDPADLRIRPEPARLQIKGAQDAIHRGACPAEVLRRPDRDPGTGAQRIALGHGDGVVPGADALPASDLGRLR